MVKILDDVSDLVCKVADPFDFLASVITEETMSEASLNAVREIQDKVVQLNQDPMLEKATRYAEERRNELNEEERAVAKQLLVEFSHQGSQLASSEREKHAELQGEMYDALTQFRSACWEPVDARKVEIDRNAVPAHALRFFPKRGGKIVVDCSDASQQQTALTYVSDEALRKEIAFSNRKSALVATEKLIAARHATASHLGFESYSHYYAWHRELKTPSEILQFLENLHFTLQPKVKQELESLRKAKKQHLGVASDIYAWDVPYYATRVKNAMEHEQAMARTSAFTRAPTSTLEEYFTLENVLRAAQLLWSALWGVQMEFISSGTESELWHPLVFKVNFYDEEKNEFLGHAYFDLITRAGKPGAANCPLRMRSERSEPSTAFLTHIQSSSTLEGTFNANRPRLEYGLGALVGGKEPVLVPFDSVTTFFHELGHLSQSMLCKNKLQHFSGTRGLMDHIETPSQVMERFASDYRFISTFAKHYKNNSVLPEQVFLDHLKTKSAFSGISINQQLVLAALDQKLHSGPPIEASTVVLKKVLEKFSPFNLHDPRDAPHAGFHHLDGYGSVYYSYLFCGVKASQIYALLFQNDPFNRKAGELYRQNFLSLGGASDPSKLLLSLSGQTHPDPSYFVRDICNGNL